MPLKYAHATASGYLGNVLNRGNNEAVTRLHQSGFGRGGGAKGDGGGGGVPEYAGRGVPGRRVCVLGPCGFSPSAGRPASGRNDR